MARTVLVRKWLVGRPFRSGIVRESRAERDPLAGVVVGNREALAAVGRVLDDEVATTEVGDVEVAFRPDRQVGLVHDARGPRAPDPDSFAGSWIDETMSPEPGNVWSWSCQVWPPSFETENMMSAAAGRIRLTRGTGRAGRRASRSRTGRHSGGWAPVGQGPERVDRQVGDDLERRTGWPV